MAVEKERPTLLVGNIREASGVLTTDSGKQEVTFQGAIGFRVVYGKQGVEDLHLIRLNLHTKGVESESGNTGTIGLMLSEPEFKTEFDAEQGGLSAGFHATLHYALIDEQMGFQEMKAKGDLCYVPYLESMEGQLGGELPPGLRPDDEGQYYIKLEVSAAIREYHVGAIQEMYMVCAVPLWWVFSAAEVLKVQPVFIGTGPDDPTATGRSYRDLFMHASEMWNRCGTERCITFDPEPPIYLDMDQYRVINSRAEYREFGGRVTVEDAVEVFFAERFETALAVDMGAGVTRASGTAAAHIITCDQQLDVPCPPPCGEGSCGDVNHYHLAHELGHALNLAHPGVFDRLRPSTPESVMEPSGFCFDNPNAQSARNCRNASNPLLYWGRGLCWGSPDIDD